MKGNEQISVEGIRRKAGAAAIAAALALGSGAFAAPALANQTAGANGVQARYGDSTQITDYQSFDSKSGAWDDSENESTKAGDFYSDGRIHLFYDTTGGTWDEPGPNPGDGGDNVSHPNGTYVVTIPTKIAYTGMRAGTVDTSDDYTVNVRGLIAGNQSVTLAAESGNALVNAAAGSEMAADITETTTQGKTVWNAAEVYGTEDADGDGAGDGAKLTTKQNADGSLLGTNCTDNIKMRGTARSAGEYVGTVGYTASLS